jgi:hypothetical protein
MSFLFFFGCIPAAYTISDFGTHTLMGPFWLVLRILFCLLEYSEDLESTEPLEKCLGLCCLLDFPLECVREPVTKFALEVLVPRLSTGFGSLTALT